MDPLLIIKTEIRIRTVFVIRTTIEGTIKMEILIVVIRFIIVIIDSHMLIVAIIVVIDMIMVVMVLSMD